MAFSILKISYPDLNIVTANLLLPIVSQTILLEINSGDCKRFICFSNQLSHFKLLTAFYTPGKVEKVVL